MTLKIALIGTGYIANYHARAARKIPGVQVAAVVNNQPQLASDFAQNYDIPRQYTSVEDLLQDGDIDAISINVPNALHAPFAITALSAGVHVIVEKPMAMNAAEAQTMIDAGQKSGALLMVAHCWRFDEEVLWLKEQVTDGKLGRIIRTKGYGVHANWGPAGWFSQAKLAGGGALVDMGIHAIDTSRFLLGDPKPTSVYSKIGTYYGDFDVDDTGIMIINWDNGVASYIESGWWQPHMDGPEASTQLYGKRGFGEVFPTHLSLPDPVAEKIETINPGFPHPRAEHCPQVMYDNQMAAFVDCIHQGRTPNPGGAEGLINMKIVDAAYESARTGKVVEIGDI